MAKRRGVSYEKRVEEINRIYDQYAKRGVPEPRDLAAVRISCISRANVHSTIYSTHIAEPETHIVTQ